MKTQKTTFEECEQIHKEWEHQYNDDKEIIDSNKKNNWSKY